MYRVLVNKLPVKLIKLDIKSVRMMATVKDVFPNKSEFPTRHIGPRKTDVVLMLDSLGFKVQTLITPWWLSLINNYSNFRHSMNLRIKWFPKTFNSIKTWRLMSHLVRLFVWSDIPNQSSRFYCFFFHPARLLKNVYNILNCCVMIISITIFALIILYFLLCSPAASNHNFCCHH